MELFQTGNFTDSDTESQGCGVDVAVFVAGSALGFLVVSFRHVEVLLGGSRLMVMMGVVVVVVIVVVGRRQVVVVRRGRRRQRCGWCDRGSGEIQVKISEPCVRSWVHYNGAPLSLHRRFRCFFWG